MFFRFLAAVAAAVSLGCSLPASAALSVARLRCEYGENPMGIETLHPRLSWQLAAGGARGQRQTAYEILVATTNRPLRHDEADVWDSGRIVSGQSVHVPYNGPALVSGRRYWWKVRVWDGKGSVSRYSKPAFWEMGLPTPGDRMAHWITAADAVEGTVGASFGKAAWIWSGESGDPSVAAPEGTRYFRRTFDLPAVGKPGGQITITADDQYTLFVNGREVGKSSGQTDAWKQPGTFDLSPFLQSGRNVVAVAAQNTSGAAGLLSDLRLHSGAVSGPLTDIGTGRTWRVSGEEAAGWQSPDFDDSAWKNARIAAPYGGGPWGRLRPSGSGGSDVGPGRYLRREFIVAKRVRSARLYASALGIYEPSLNGQRVGSDIFAPGWTDYRKRVMYQTYDVTRIVRRGANALGLILSDGWYAGHVGLVGRGVYGDVPLAWCQLRLDYEDGTTETIVSDEKWRGMTAGPIVGADLLEGETYDARKEIRGWNAPGFDDTRWTAAQTQQSGAPLEAQRGPSVTVQEELRPHAVRTIKPGVTIFDLGQNMVGWARLQAVGAPGTRVTLRFAEMLNPDGTIYTTNYRSARCTDTYTLRGDRRGETYEPRFTFRGFRYVEVTGLDHADRTTITGVVVHSDTPRVGSMETSSPLVNQLLKNIDWGQRGNFLSVPTDCPQRDERLGWMGDAQIFVRTATYGRDVAGFFTKWLVDVDDAQSAAGAFSDVSPRVTAGEGTAAWGDAGVICPWTIYLAYADKQILADHYDAMARWVAYCEQHSSGLLRPAAGYGDWLSIRADTPKDVLATAYFAYSTHLVAQAAKVLGKDADAAHYEDLFQQIKTAFDRAYVAPDGRIKGDTQTDYLLALRFDLMPDALRPVAARYLAENIAARDNHLSTGFVGVGYLCPVLSDAGYDNVAYRLLNNDTFPSWGYSIRHGATTIWERWDGWTEEKGFQDPGMNSFNHYSFGSVGEWLYGYAAGIQLDPADPGFHHIILRPRPGGGLTYAKAAFDSLYGPITSAWNTSTNGSLDLNVTIPANTTATVYVPATSESAVREGDKPASQVEGIRFLRMENNAAVYEVGSGDYRFHTGR